MCAYPEEGRHALPNSTQYPIDMIFTKIDVLRLKAEYQGDAEAQFQLGECYETGDTVDKDLQQAAKWYRMAAGQGYEPASEALKRLGM